MSEETSNLSVLDSEHLDAFRKALGRILSTSVAETTYSEILDGLPTIDSFYDFHFRQDEHPIFVMNHTALCPGVVERIREFRQDFDPLQLTLSSTIAVYLFDLDDGVHKHHVYEEWRDRPRDYVRPGQYYAPTTFYHGTYVDFDQYPNGLADVTGYWAEAKIFGGVVVFDRGPSGTECRDLFLHPASLDGPQTIFPPTPAQYDALVGFLLGPDSPSDASCPLPIRAPSENQWRYDPWDSMTRFNIFRDRYERRPPEGDRPEHRVKSAVDWPELGDEHLAFLRLWERSQGKEVDQAEFDAAYERLEQITPSSPLWPRNKDPGPPWNGDSVNPERRALAFWVLITRQLCRKIVTRLGQIVPAAHLPSVLEAVPVPARELNADQYLWLIWTVP